MNATVLIAIDQDPSFFTNSWRRLDLWAASVDSVPGHVCEDKVERTGVQSEQVLCDRLGNTDGFIDE